MTKKVFVATEHSFYDPLATMLISLSSYMFTMHVSRESNKPKPFHERSLAEYISYIAPIKDLHFPFALTCNATSEDFVFFPMLLIAHISLDTWPQYIECDIIPTQSGTSGNVLSGVGNRRILRRILGTAFVSYYSDMENKIKTKHLSDQENWPNALRFAWFFRNAMAHDNDGRLQFRDPKRKPITWHRWTFSQSDHGVEMLLGNNTLGPGDVVLLMEEIDALLK